MTVPGVIPAAVLLGATAGEPLPAAAVPAAQQTLEAAYAYETGAIRQWVTQAVATAWLALGRWSDPQVPEFRDAVLPVLTAAIQQMARLTASHLAGQLSLARERRIDLTPVELPFYPEDLTAEYLRGITPDQEWRRPFETVWRELAAGQPIEEAVTRGGRRANQLAATDIQLAKTHSARTLLEREEDVVGYRRVLTGTESCARCVIASTLRYKKDQLLPIHTACDCGVAPILEGQDWRAEGVDIDQLHDAIARDLGEDYVDRGGRGAINYRDIVVVHEHGEIGPVIAVRGHDFTGPGDVKTAGSSPPAGPGRGTA